MMYKHIPSIPGGLLLAGLLLAVPAAAQDEEPGYDDAAETCIDLRSVRRTEIVDDRNVLFHMRGDVVYHNVLPRACHGLAREDRFSYQTSMSRLCRLDSIRVLHDDPFGLREGISCQLGDFHKITREDAKAFSEDSNRGPQAKPLPMPSPEEVGNGDEVGEEDIEPEPR